MTTTSNYQLNQWSATDQVKRTDFNADNQKIDAALKECAKVAYGSYTGTGTYGTSKPNSLDFATTLGEAPKLLIVQEQNYIMPMIAVRGVLGCLPISDSNSMLEITWSNTKVIWCNTHSAKYQFNAQGTTYYYIAIA